ncbi:toxin glutamine deamidase domain-containing protein [Saccharomonospora sp. NPDC006951]
MAMMVSPEVAKLFQVLTGEEWPDANEDKLRALAAEWQGSAEDLADLAVGLRGAVDGIRSNFEGEAARAFIERVSPFIEGDRLIDAAAELFQGLGDYLVDLALDVEYMKLVIINSLIALLVEIALAIKLAPFTGGASMSWLAARIPIVRFFVNTVLRKVITEIVKLAVYSIAFQLLVDVAAQVTQYGMGTRDEWNTDHTKNAAAVGAMGAALAPLAGGLGAIVGSGLNKMLNTAFAKRFGDDWAKGAVNNITEIGTESFHEVFTEALYKYATEGEFELNPYAATAGAFSGLAGVTGGALGGLLEKYLGGSGRSGGSGSRGEGDLSGGPAPEQAGSGGNGLGNGTGNGTGSGTGNAVGGNGSSDNGPGNNGTGGNGSGNSGPANGGLGNGGPANGGLGNGGLGNGPGGNGPVGSNGSADPVGSGESLGSNDFRPGPNPSQGNAPQGGADGSTGDNPVGNTPAGNNQTTPSTVPPVVAPNSPEQVFTPPVGEQPSAVPGPAVTSPAGPDGVLTPDASDQPAPPTATGGHDPAPMPEGSGPGGHQPPVADAGGTGTNDNGTNGTKDSNGAAPDVHQAQPPAGGHSGSNPNAMPPGPADTPGSVPEHGGQNQNSPAPPVSRGPNDAPSLPGPESQQSPAPAPAQPDSPQAAPPRGEQVAQNDGGQPAPPVTGSNNTVGGQPAPNPVTSPVTQSPNNPASNHPATPNSPAPNPPGNNPARPSTPLPSTSGGKGRKPATGAKGSKDTTGSTPLTTSATEAPVMPGSSKQAPESREAVVGGPDSGFHTDSVGAPFESAYSPNPAPPIPAPPANPNPNQGSGKRSRDTFESQDGPSTFFEPPGVRERPATLNPASGKDTAALREVVAPGQSYVDPALWVGLVRGSRPDQNFADCVACSVAGFLTWDGRPEVAGSLPGGPPRGATTWAAERLNSPWEQTGHGKDSFTEVADRVRKGGHGSAAVVVGFPPQGVRRPGHSWLVVNHLGDVRLLDPQQGTNDRFSDTVLPDLGRVDAIVKPVTERDPAAEAAFREFIDLNQVDLDPKPGTSLTMARDYYQRLATSTFDHPVDGRLPIPTQHPEDGCYIRAHHWSEMLKDWGADVRKVFVGRPPPGLWTQSNFALGATNSTPQPINWSYHVAPLISIDPQNGNGPEWVVLDPAMNHGVLPLRDWLTLAGADGGFDERDLSQARPHPDAYEGPLAQGETKVMVTEDHAIFPPWLDVTFPDSLASAENMMLEFQDILRNYGNEATGRQEFRQWHESLPPIAQGNFDFLNMWLDPGGRRDFQDWFMSLTPGERAGFTNDLGNPNSTVDTLVPSWDNRTEAARRLLGNADEAGRAAAREWAENNVSSHHDTVFSDPGLIQGIKDVLAYRYHADGAYGAIAASVSLGTEYGTLLPLGAGGQGPYGGFDLNEFLTFPDTLPGAGQNGDFHTDSVGAPIEPDGPVPGAERTLAEVTRARDDIEAAYGKAWNSHQTAQQHLRAAEGSARDAEGAVIGTQQAQDRADQRVRQAQARFDELAAQHNLRSTARDDFARNNPDLAVRIIRAQEAAEDARADLASATSNQDRLDAEVRHRAEALRRLNALQHQLSVLDDQRAAAEAAAGTARQTLDQVRADAAVINASTRAAVTANDNATRAVADARAAVETAARELEAVAANRPVASELAGNAQNSLTGVKNAADAVNTAVGEVNDHNARIGQATAEAAEFGNRRDQHSAQLGRIDRRLEWIGQRLDTLPDQRAGTERQDLQTERANLRGERERVAGQRDEAEANRDAAQTRADELAGDTGPRDRHDTALRNLGDSLGGLDGALTEIRAVETRSNTHGDAANTAAQEARRAKDSAEEAAKQGKVERGLTVLSGLPPHSRIIIETLGSPDALADALAGVTGYDRDAIAAWLGDLGTEGLANALNTGRLPLVAPDGATIEVAVHADLHRPDDTATAPRHREPSSVRKEAAEEVSAPLNESTTSSVPVRIPLMFVSPFDAVGGAMRPMVYAGARMKRSQGFDSTTTSSTSTGTEQTLHVPATMSVTVAVPGRAPRVATVAAGLRLPDITPGTAPAGPVPSSAFGGELKPAPVPVPIAFTGKLGTSAEASEKLTAQLLAPLGNPLPATVSFNGNDVPITPAGNPSITYAGTTAVDHTTGTSHGNGSSVTRGGDAIFGAGLYGGLKGWFAGLFTDFTTGVTDGTSPANEKSVSRTGNDTELVYTVDRSIRVGEGDDAVQGTVSSSVQVPVPLARSLGLPLPPHLDGAEANPDHGQPYVFGRDSINEVKSGAIIDFLSDKLVKIESAGREPDPAGREAVAKRFGSESGARDAIYNALHGGEQLTWYRDGRVHTAVVYAKPVAPESTAPSGKTGMGTEDGNAEQFRRTYEGKRTFQGGVGGAFQPTGKDTPDPAAPKTTPEAGNPQPYQGGPTISSGAPRAGLTFGGEAGTANKSGYTGKDGRAGKYDGDIRDYDGTLDFVVVRSARKTPGWARRFFLGGRMLFGGDAAGRITHPGKADIDQAFTGGTASRHVHTGRVENAITVSTPADKLAWSAKPVPAGGMRPGIYLGAPPEPAPGSKVNRGRGSEFATLEHLRITPDTTEAVKIALAKRITPGEGPGQVTRTPPAHSGNWSSPGLREFADIRAEGTTTYRYKESALTVPGSTPGDAVSEFIGQVGSRGTATQGFSGQQHTTGTMSQPGRLTDFNGELKGEATFYSPRVVSVRPEGTLRRNQAGDSLIGSTKSSGFGVDLGVSANAMPRREGRAGAALRGIVGGGWKKGTSETNDLTPGGKQTSEYKGPTAFVVTDVRYAFQADMNLRNMFTTGTFDPVQVTVDVPDGAIEEMPVADAADLFRNMGLPVPPELSQAVQRTDVTTPAHTLLGQADGYDSFSDTAVARSALNDPGLTAVTGRLAELGVTDKNWQREILGQIRKHLSTPAGHLWLRDVLAGTEGNGGLISVPNSGFALEDVVDIRVTASPNPDAVTGDGQRATVPAKQTSADYLTSAKQIKNSTTVAGAAALEAGVVYRETPAVPPGKPDENGTIRQSAPEPGATFASVTPQIFGISKSVRTEEIAPGSSSEKVTSQTDVNKVGRSTHGVDFRLDISRRRAPMPSVSTPFLDVPMLVDRDRTAGTPVTVPGVVDLISPGADTSPPLTRPQDRPTFDVVADVPGGEPMFGRKGGWRVEQLGIGTVNAIRDAMYALLSNTPLREGIGGVDPGRIRTAADSASGYTRQGGNSETHAHNATKGTSLRHGMNTIFTSGDYRLGRILGNRHVTYDSLFDATITGEFRQDSFRFVTALPEGTEMNLGKDVESGKPRGKTKVVSTASGPALPWLAGDSGKAAGPAPTTATTGPPVSEGISVDDTVEAKAAKTGGTSGVKYEGRSYLYTADADFFVKVERYGSNWTRQPFAAMADLFRGGGQGHNVLKVGSTGDLRVRVWENEALDQGLLTLGDVFRYAGKNAPGEHAVVPDRSGATIHGSGRRAPEAPAPDGALPRGRNLHVGNDVTLENLRTFIGSLPADMRPWSYTVEPGSALTPEAIGAAVNGLPEPATQANPPRTVDPGLTGGASDAAPALPRGMLDAGQASVLPEGSAVSRGSFRSVAEEESYFAGRYGNLRGIVQDWNAENCLPATIQGSFAIMENDTFVAERSGPTRIGDVNDLVGTDFRETSYAEIHEHMRTQERGAQGVVFTGGDGAQGHYFLVHKDDRGVVNFVDVKNESMADLDSPRPVTGFVPLPWTGATEQGSSVPDPGRPDGDVSPEVFDPARLTGPQREQLEPHGANVITTGGGTGRAANLLEAITKNFDEHATPELYRRIEERLGAVTAGNDGIDGIAREAGLRVHVLRPDGGWTAHGPAGGRPVHVVEADLEGTPRFLGVREDVQLGRPGVSYPGPTTTESGGTKHLEHRGEFEVETIAGKHYVRMYTAMYDAAGPDSRFKDVHQDPATGEITVSTGSGAVAWVSGGRPLRTVQWIEKYRNQQIAKGEKGYTPLLRSYLVPLERYQAASENARSEKVAGVGTTMNVDQGGDVNQFGMRGDDLAKLQRHAVAGSLVTYVPDGSEAHTGRDVSGRVEAVSELYERLGLPAGFRSTDLGLHNDPWFEWKRDKTGKYTFGGFRNDPSGLADLANRLREGYALWAPGWSGAALLEPNESPPSARRASADRPEGDPRRRLNEFVNTTYGPLANIFDRVTDAIRAGVGQVAGNAVPPATPADKGTLLEYLETALKPVTKPKELGAFESIIRGMNGPESAGLPHGVQLARLADSIGHGNQHHGSFADTVITPMAGKLAEGAVADTRYEILDQRSRRELHRILAEHIGRHLRTRFTQLAAEGSALVEELKPLADGGKKAGWLSGERLKVFLDHVRTGAVNDPALETAVRAAPLTADPGAVRKAIEGPVMDGVREETIDTVLKENLIGLTPAEQAAKLDEALGEVFRNSVRDRINGEPGLEALERAARENLAEKVSGGAAGTVERAVKKVSFPSVSQDEVDTFMRTKVATFATMAQIGATIAADAQRNKADFDTRDSEHGAFRNEFGTWREQHTLGYTQHGDPAEFRRQREIGDELRLAIEHELRTAGEGRVDPESAGRIVDTLIERVDEAAPGYHESLRRKFDEVVKVQGSDKQYRAKDTGHPVIYHEHAQMVLNQFLSLTAGDDDGARFVSREALAKAILFHDMDKQNSKNQYGDDQVRHDREPEHRGAVKYLNRHEGLWSSERDFRLARAIVDSDPFGGYLRGKHSLDTAYRFIRELAHEHGRPDGEPVTAADVRKLFDEFHQYYQADASSYTNQVRYVNPKNNEVETGSAQLRVVAQDGDDGPLVKTGDGRHFEYPGPKPGQGKESYREKFGRLRARFDRDVLEGRSYEPRGRRPLDPELSGGAGRRPEHVERALAFHAGFHGNGNGNGGIGDGRPAPALPYAPEMFSRGSAGVAEVIDRVASGGNGSAAVLLGKAEQGSEHAWNVVNHDGVVSIVDSMTGAVVRAGSAAFTSLDQVYAVPVDANGAYLTDGAPPPVLPAGADAYTAAEHARAEAAYRMRAAAAAGEDIPVPGTGGRLVPTIEGLRLVGAAITVELAAELAALSGRRLLVFVIGPDAVEDERDDEPVGEHLLLMVPPRGRPEPVDVTEPAEAGETSSG